MMKQRSANIETFHQWISIDIGRDLHRKFHSLNSFKNSIRRKPFVSYFDNTMSLVRNEDFVLDIKLNLEHVQLTTKTKSTDFYFDYDDMFARILTSWIEEWSRTRSISFVIDSFKQWNIGREREELSFEQK